MAQRLASLGTAGSAADTITISGSTNATPIVITLGAGHGKKTGDRIAIAGITGNTAANGEWTLNFTGTNTAQLLGSVGNGTHGGTPRVATIFDQAPGLMRGHAAVISLGGNLVGSLTLTGFESYAEFAANDNSLLGTVVAPVQGNGATGVTNTNATSASSSTKATSVIAQTAAMAGLELEVKLNRYVHATVSAYTSGSIYPTITG